MYLLCGDGEPGQKVFLGAKDGQQVRANLAKHCFEMLRQSPELLEECTTNKNQMSILHEPSRSVLMPLSSSNERTTDAKEGLNGCLMIDETHVVDESFMGKLSRMHLSRAEPLQIEVSTAGSNPEGYGKKRFDYAQQVLAGDVHDQELFAAIYAAPQDATDAEIVADPMKYGRMANPAMGHTIDPDEFMGDFERSKTSITDFNQFKMYRLNIWSNAANPWLKSEDWRGCADEYADESLHGERCWAGLDLAKTTDLTALVLMFRDGDTYRQLPFFFMPEEQASAKQKHAPYLQWERDGYLILTPGDVCDYDFVFSKIAELKQEYNIRGLAFDPYNAEHLTQRVQEELGIERHSFGQTIVNFAEPTKEYERLVISGELRHNNHPLLNWQAGHVEVKSDANNNIRPVKRKHGDHRTIDGIVAGIMALALARSDKNKPSVYNRRGVIAV